MKKVMISTLWLCISFVCLAQSPYTYNAKGEKIHYRQNRSRILVKAEQKSQLTKDGGVKGITTIKEMTNEYFIIDIDTLQTNMSEIKKAGGLQNSVYVLEAENGSWLAPTNEIFLKCKANISINKILPLLGNRVISTELIIPSQSVYLLGFDIPLDSILETTTNLYQTGMFEFVEPSFFRQFDFYNPPATNPQFGNQWGLHNQSNGCDINVLPAWKITKGSPDVKVAVVDDGIMLNHTDLQGNLLQGFDAEYNSALFEEMGGNKCGFGYNENEEYVYGCDSHGTNCAGIIAAMDNDKCIIGVAPESKLIPVWIGYSRKRDIRDTWIVRGINYAWDDGEADIISCSWGSYFESEAVALSIKAATLEGRDNLGCIVVVSSGNGGAIVAFPASMPETISVGAIINTCEKWIDSNYGDDLDVVAPGGEHNIYSTSVNINNDGTCNPSFGGTSAACPHVAGVAALMLSVNPDLTWQEVKHLISYNAKKIGNYDYSTIKEHGAWNENVGYGLVDAAACVYAAMVYPDCSSATFMKDMELSFTQEYISDCIIVVDNLSIDCDTNLILESDNYTLIKKGFEMQKGATLEIR